MCPLLIFNILSSTLFILRHQESVGAFVPVYWRRNPNGGLERGRNRIADVVSLPVPADEQAGTDVGG